MPWEASTASQRRRKIMEWFIWMLVLVAAGFAVVLMAIGLYGLMLAALTVGVPAAFMSGNPGLGFLANRMEERQKHGPKADVGERNAQVVTDPYQKELLFGMTVEDLRFLR